MVHPLKTLIVGAAIALLSVAAQAQPAPAPGGAPPGGRPGAPPQRPETKGAEPLVQYRTELMNTIQHQTAALGAIVQKQVPHDANAALHLQTIALTARAALKAFEPKAPGGTAKGTAIWDNWKDFSDKFKALDVAATELAKKAAAGPITREDLMTVQTCRGCHMEYRDLGPR